MLLIDEVNVIIAFIYFLHKTENCRERKSMKKKEKKKQQLLPQKLNKLISKYCVKRI